ncbi:hypothetical protein ARALYDRAFT_473791, partial [Arabidopsis lyrata subsp. lyrata]
APEVILGLPYDEKLICGLLGFSSKTLSHILKKLTSNTNKMYQSVAMILVRIVTVLGLLETEMLEKGQETHKYFTKEYDLYHLNEIKNFDISKKKTQKTYCLNESNKIEYIITEELCLEEQLHVSDELFLDFVKSILEINPLIRPTALEVLNHPWLSSSSYNS